MRIKGEIVFPNNIRELRLRKQLTQARLGRLMDPPSRPFQRWRAASGD